MCSFSEVSLVSSILQTSPVLDDNQQATRGDTGVPNNPNLVKDNEAEADILPSATTTSIDFSIVDISF